jgi:N-acetylneuraminic acid mutarotase
MTSHDLKLMIGMLAGILFIVTGSFLPLLCINQMAVLAQLEKSHWTTGAPLPTPRSEIAGTVLNDKIYVVGGFDSSGRSTSTIEVYDPMLDEWTQVTWLPQPLDHTAAAVATASHEGKLYIVGGSYLDRDSLSDKLFIYDSITNNWTEGANLPSARGALTANFINGTLYVTGGVDSKNTLSSTLAYDPITNNWTEKASMPTAREHLTSSVVDGKLYVIGGRTNGMAFNVDANEAYDPITDKWTILEPMPSKRGGLSSASVNGSIYVFGGEQPDGTFDRNERYDTMLNIWTHEVSMPTARHGLASEAIDNDIYVIGGGPLPGGSRTDVNEIFHTAAS